MNSQKVIDYKGRLYELANDMKCDSEIIYDIKDESDIMKALIFFW